MRGYLKSNTIHTVWYHVSAFASILEIECALQITGMEKTTSVMNKCTNSASSVTELNGRLCFRLGSTQPQFLLCRKKKHCYTCNRHVRAFFHSSVLPICWAYCLSSLCHTGRQHSQEGEQELKHVEGGFLLFPPTQVVSKVTCGGILQEHCWNMLWFSSGCFLSVERRWEQGLEKYGPHPVLIPIQLEIQLYLRAQGYTQVLHLRCCCCRFPLHWSEYCDRCLIGGF